MPHIRSFVIALACALYVTPAMAQTNHALHHDVYQNWVNQRDKGCCNDQDCGELSDENERPSPRGRGIEVRIEGEWCPVETWHYLKRGNAPNWTTSHVCVLKRYNGFTQNNTPACERLLCYQPKPGI